MSPSQAAAAATAVAVLVAALTVGGAMRAGVGAGRTPAPAICHVAARGDDLLRSTRCSRRTLVYRLGYVPEVVRLPSGRSVHVEPDGSCSALPDRPFGFDFRDACRMHDLGYDLIRVRWVDAAAKSDIDRALLDAMVDTCARERGLRRLACRALAGLAWLAASLCPVPRTPDPGAFSVPDPRAPPQPRAALTAGSAARRALPPPSPARVAATPQPQEQP